MNFELTEEQRAVAELAGQILRDRSTPERLAALEASAENVDRATWSELATANLLGVSLAEDVGGSGLGFLPTALIAEEIGRRTARVPVVPTVVMGAMAIDAFGSDDLRRRVLPSVVSGASILTAALVEIGAAPGRPLSRARRDGGSWRLDGVKICVPSGLDAELVLVPAATEAGGVGIFVVDPTSAGVAREIVETTDGVAEARLELDGASVGLGDVLGDPQGDPRRAVEIVQWIEDRTTAALSMVASGACQEALRLTAEYTKQREQFDRPIGSFQAVGQRIADAYIDTEAVRLTALQASWRLDAGMDAARAVDIAKFWAAEGGQRVLLAAQHLHGGVGVDRDYPLHRYFLTMKKIELTLGGASEHLAHLGKALAEEPA